MIFADGDGITDNSIVASRGVHHCHPYVSERQAIIAPRIEETFVLTVNFTTVMWRVHNSSFRTAYSRPVSRAAVCFPAGADQIRLARRPKFGWRRRQTFPAAAAAEFGASS